MKIDTHSLCDTVQILAPVATQATDLSKLKSEVSRTKADLKVAESRIALLQQSTMSREEIRKAVLRLAGDKVCAGSAMLMWPLALQQRTELHRRSSPAGHPQSSSLFCQATACTTT